MYALLDVNRGGWTSRRRNMEEVESPETMLAKPDSGVQALPFVTTSSSAPPILGSSVFPPVGARSARRKPTSGKKLKWMPDSALASLDALTGVYKGWEAL
jgi:hypothetical protein